MKVIEESLLKTVRDLVEAHFGIACPDSQFPVFEKKMTQVLIDVSEQHSLDVASAAKSDAQRLLSLILPKVTVGETFFFRNRAQFEALRQRVLPELSGQLKPGTPLIFWSAGCSSGEEPYSLAMWVREYAPDLFPSRIKIIATDVNPQAIARARAGRFTKRSFRQNDAYWIHKYFRQIEGEFILDEATKEVVSFQEHNLVSGALPLGLPPRGASLVFCRNVLIYFAASRVQQILRLFMDALSPEGFLMLGHAEAFAVLNEWQRNYLPGTFFYQKPLPGGVKKSPRAKAALPGSPCPSAMVPAPVLAEKTSLPRVRLRPRAAPRAEIAGKKTPEDDLAVIRKHLEAGALQECMELLQQLLRREKTCVQAYFLLALCADQAGDTERAHAAMKNALFLDKSLVMGHYFLGALNERKGDTEAAIRNYQTVCRLLGHHDDAEMVPHGDWLTAGYVREIARVRTQELQTQGLDAEVEGDHGSATQST